MKKVVSVINIVCFSIFILISSCEKNDSLLEEESQIVQDEIKNDFNNKKEFHIYYAEWDEWGRKKRDCRGWGLCNYVDCWFCCIENGVIVDCDDGEKVKNSGTFIIDVDTNTGFLIIELDPDIVIQNEAIIAQKTLFVDEDIVYPKSEVLKGDYIFDQTVGENGGYKLNAIWKE